MSSSKQECPTTSEIKNSTWKRGTSLNPHAAAFVPFSYRGSSTSNSISDGAAKFPVSGSSGNHMFDRSKSSISTNSDEEAHQYWQCQLPDDITPDFNVMGEDESLEVGGSLSLAGLSLHDNSEANRFNATVGHGLMFNSQLDASSHHTNGGDVLDKIRHAESVYGVDSSSTYVHKTSKPWEMQALCTDYQFEDERVGSSLNEGMRLSYPDDMGGQSSIYESNSVNPVDLLASQFPGFAAESLAEVYFASGCDLNLTIEMLTQLELQVDGAFNQNMNSKTLSAPNLTPVDFPALPVPDNKTNLAKDGLRQTANPFGTEDNMLFFKSASSLTGKGATDFASAVRKLASQNTGLWKYDRNSSSDAAAGSSRSSRALSPTYSTSAMKNTYVDRLQSRGSARPAPVWLETGDTVANLYSELREDARDHARIRNAYFEQARQAYLIGNKALAKELSVKGQLHNMEMKAAHNQAQESIYRQRNPINAGQGFGRGQEKMIDLHGLHVSEAIHILRNELSVLTKAARSAQQRVHVYICVGTGHHTKGSRTPARLPIAVQRFLLEEEGLEYTEPQPGLLRVVLY